VSYTVLEKAHIDRESMSKKGTKKSQRKTDTITFQPEIAVQEKLNSIISSSFSGKDARGAQSRLINTLLGDSLADVNVIMRAIDQRIHNLSEIRSAVSLENADKRKRRDESEQNGG
jgi:hypothetical protein